MASHAGSIKPLSSLLFIGGALLFFVGAREFLGSIIGQREAAAAWEAPPLPGERDVPAAHDAAKAADPGPALARLSIPRLHASWFVLEGIGKRQLRAGPGHVPGTALPGAEGNCVITAHRDTHFRALKDVRKGDEILVETRQGRFQYRVTGMRVVKPANTESLKPSSRAVMNLITCYPFYWVGPAPKRYVVQAELETAADTEGAAATPAGIVKWADAR